VDPDFLVVLYIACRGNDSTLVAKIIVA